MSDEDVSDEDVSDEGELEEDGFAAFLLAEPKIPIFDSSK